MPTTNAGRLQGASINRTVIEVLTGTTADKQIVSAQLNAVLKSELTNSAEMSQQTALAKLLETLAPGDLSTDQNLSLRDFVTKHTILPTDPAAGRSALAAIATLSSTTTVSAFLGLSATVAGNPHLSGMVAQTNLATLLSTSPALGTAQLQTDFIAKYTAFRGTARDFWVQLSQDAEFKTAIPELQFTCQLGVLTLNHSQLVSALRTTYKPSSLRDLTKLDAPTLAQFLSSQRLAAPAGISGSTPAEQITNYANGMISLLEAAFPTDYVAKALAASTDVTLPSVAKVLHDMPDIDLHATIIDAYLEQNSTKAFLNVEADQVAAVTAQLKSVQRVFRISQDPSTVTALLAAGLDSASKIAALSQTAFLNTFSSALGGTPQAQTVHAVASHIRAEALNTFLTVQSGLKEINPRAIGNPAFNLAQKIEQHIPNWETLFGSGSFCECGECGSVYGAAAYFVDLLHFLSKESSKANAFCFTPLDVLIGATHDQTTVIGRRPDLPYIKLDCKNTNTPLPYIDLINEILESYITLGGKLNQSTAQNTPSDATADELSVNPEYTIDSAYTSLSNATYPVSLPYDRFLDVARRYLAFLGGNRQQVIELFQTQKAPVDNASALAAETLGLSEGDVRLIAGWDVRSGSAAASPPLSALYAGNTPITDASDTPVPFEKWIAGVPTFLGQTGLAFEDLIHLLETQFVNPGQSITLASATACDLSQTTIASLDDPALARILPFLRLWRKLGWPMSELDKVLRVLAPSGINRRCLLGLADLTQLMAQLNLPLPQLISLWSNIDTDGRDSLYARLFQNKAVLNPVDLALRISYRAALPALPATALPPSVAGQTSYDNANHQLVFTGAMTDDQRSDFAAWASGNASAALAVDNLYEMRWAQGTEIASGATITDSSPGILAALRISPDDLNAIRITTNLADTATKTPLSLANLSQIYRHAIFAQAIGISIPDFLSLLSLTGINPFHLASTNSAISPAARFVQASQAVAASPFSVAQLNYIYRAIANPPAGTGLLQANMDQLVLTLQTGLQKLAGANTYTPDPSGKLLRKKLGVVLGSAQLTAAMNLIDGTGEYTTSLTALPPGVVFPNALALRISYDSANQLLRLVGAIRDTEFAELNSLSIDAGYRTAISDLYQQPRTLLSAGLAFLNPTDALANLINAPSPMATDRYAWVLQNLLSYLTDTQSHSLVQQTLSQALALDSDSTTLLLSGGLAPASPALLKSQRDASQASIVDLLDLRDGGLMATYFSDTALTAVTATRIDATVNVGADGATVPNPAGVRWRGKVLPEFSESYTFYVTANDGLRLWVNNQLLINQWTNQVVSTRTSASVNLNAGQLYDIRLDYFNASAAARAVLGWSSKSTNNNVNVAIPQSALFPGNAFQTLSRLDPIGLLLSTFAVKAGELAWLSSHPANFAGVDPDNAANTVTFDLSALPVDRSNPASVDGKAVPFFYQWLHLNDLFALRKSLPAGNVTLFDVFRVAAGSTSPTHLGSATLSAVLAATGWDAGEFATLSGKITAGSAVIGFGLSDADFVNAAGLKGTGLVWLKKCLDLGSRLGVPAVQLFSWANNPPSSQQANDIRNTVKAKYDDASWVAAGKPLSNQIRDDSKAALIAYVLNLPAIIALGLTNADQLYEYFLIDVQMSSCMLTSRIVQANAAIQLFVQRCLLNLENGTSPNSVAPDAIDAAQWEWRKNYRVWEANRRVFLYPENWIDPTLRDNRTPFFKDLQTELQRGEVTADLAEQAFHNYLTKLLEVSRLEICGFYCEKDTDAVTGVTHDIFHVFGRTFATPHVYYYRQFDNVTRIWSAWERVDADIQGDHLIPVIWNRRLFLFWAIFKEHCTPNTAAPGNVVAIPPVSITGGPAPTALPLKSLQVKLAWSEYRHGAWTKKQVTVDSLTPYGFDSYTADFDPGILSFRALPGAAGLTVTVYCWALAEGAVPLPDIPPVIPGAYTLFNVGLIAFSGCSTTPAILPAESLNLAEPNMQGVPIPFYTTFDNMTLSESTGNNQPPIGANKLTLTALVESGSYHTSDGFLLPWYTLSPLSILGSTAVAPPPYTLSYPQQFLPNLQAEVRGSPWWRNVAPPFFYADGIHTYLARKEAPQFVAILREPVNAVVSFSLEELNPPASSPSRISQLPIFERRRSAITAVTEPSVVRSTTTTGESVLGSDGSVVDPLPAWQGVFERPQFSFATHYHPHVCDFLKALNWQGVPGLLTLDNQRIDSADVGTASAFFTTYNPTDVVSLPYPSQEIDFSLSGAYSCYNWELFFHIPFLIATQLSRNQRFEDAEEWFRYVFNPTSNSADPVPGRYWNVLPFSENTEPERIDDLIRALEYSGTDDVALLNAQAEFSQQIAAWQHTPFDPDLIARMRLGAYQKAVVMKYIDHHLAWGDSLYRQFTRESVNEATLHYVLCQDLLGDKPVRVPPQGLIPDLTYSLLATGSPGLDKFSDALVAMENLFPFSTDAATSISGDSGSGTATGIAMVPYFCIPPNTILLDYWDRVAQRLFQIRHCMNIAGQVQQLALFAPPIDPGQLIRSLAMGMDLTSALNDIHAATPFYRFGYMLPKALELCAEVRSLGASLLSTLEKSDAEGLSMLRATQETALMKAVRNVKQQQLNEANSNVDALTDSLAVTQNRQQYYQSLLSAGLSSYEKTQISLLNQAQTFQAISQQAQLLGSSVGGTPNANLGFVGPFQVTYLNAGGTQLGAVANFVAGGFGMLAAMSSSSGNIAGLQGGFARRTQEWTFQAQTAALEIQQINDQIKAGNARVEAAQADLDNQDLQISNSSDTEQFLRTKYTNQALYDWMVGQVSSVFFQCYQMAYDLAKRAEACFVFERMPDLSSYTPFVQFGYWDSLKKGLLSGELLYQDLKRLEIAFMDQNQRDYEITKSISLLLLDPMALINLKETGQCTVQFPEALFDMDYPGHYLRRVKSVGVTIPCVVGPYAGVYCTLTLAGNKIRMNNIAADAKDYVKDSHYVTNFAAAESIATSSAQNDSGLFMVNFNDERYLPFEGAGVISTWQLSMPRDTNAFDFDTITDVIFNLRYTARDGGSALRGIAKAAAVLPPPSSPGATPATQTALANQTNLTRMFSLRHEFPSDWHNFLHPPDSAPDQAMTINLTQERFPFQYRGKKIQIYQVDVFLKFRDIYDPVKYVADGTPLGDYAAPLTLNVTPPLGTAKAIQLVKNAAILAGVPHGTVPQPAPIVPPLPPPLGGLGGWTLVAKGADINKVVASLQEQVTSGTATFNRLAVDAIEDIVVVCQFAPV